MSTRPVVPCHKLSVRDGLTARLRRLLGDDAVIDHPDALAVYECDGYTLERATPDMVALPLSLIHI